MNQTLIQAFVAGLVLSTASFAQDSGSNSASAPKIGAGLETVQHELDSWRSAHGATWQMKFDEKVGYARFLFSGSAPAVFTPKSDADFFSLGRYWLEQTKSLHGVDTSDLVEDEVVFLPLSLAGTTDKMTVQFRQEKNGVPVLDGFANVLFDTHGVLLSVDTTGARQIGALSTTPSIAAERARTIATKWFHDDTGLSATSVSDARLVIDPSDRGDFVVSTLAWEVNVQFQDPNGFADGYYYRVDAHNGSQSSRVKSVHEDVSGTVQSMATPGAFPDKSTNLPTSQPMPYLNVTSSSGNAKTDANGNFTIVGASAPLNVTVKYQAGTYATVNNSGGTAYSLTQTLNSASGNSILMNATPTALVTAQANGFEWIGKMRDWIRSVNPADAKADFLHTVNVNIASTCNAYYNGSSTNFYRSGGGCANTGYSSVVLHENGHWMNDKYSSGNGSDGFGEGNADNFSTFLLDDPIVGHDFCGTGCNVRNANNLRQFCGDCCGGCYGEVHNDGEVLMGALWKVRTKLKTSLGNSLGIQTSNTLFNSWMNAYNDGQIKTIIETHWLTLDDNDGNLSNGTPHFGDIDGGFKIQGFPGYPLTFVVVSNVTQIATSSNPGPYTINADVVAQLNPPITSAVIKYSVNNGAFQTVNMSFVSGNTWTGDIPSQVGCPDTMKYYVTGFDSINQPGSFPTNAPATTLTWTINCPPACPPATNYCVSKQTSIGTFPVIGSTGTAQLSTNNFVVTLDNGTVGKSALVFWGVLPNNVPFDGGTLCVKPPLIRGPIQTTDIFGTASTAFPIVAGDVGTTYYFQWWMRDPQDPFTVGLSDGLSAQVCN